MIHVLDNHTINKIAAGEVVERPASVVKELVENSIDAKASAVTIEIQEGGISMIRITDNGVGIPSDSVEMAFLRHATSKIETETDLERVLSLGFRGEALASIASVSQLEIITKTRDTVTGKRMELHAGKVVGNEEVGCTEGTTIIMRHLFYNTPARKKFLQSSASEAAKISDIVYKLALGHPEISFKYINNNKMVFHTSGNNNLRNCVMNVYGKEIAKESIELRFEGEELSVVGILGKPTISRSNRLYENFFINGRYIKSDVLQSAVEDAYKTLLMIGKFPVVVLHLHISPENIDVNVHPTKMEVRFKDKEQIYEFIYGTVRKALTSENLIPQVPLYTPKKREKETGHIQETLPETTLKPQDVVPLKKQSEPNDCNDLNNIKHSDSPYEAATPRKDIFVREVKGQHTSATNLQQNDRKEKQLDRNMPQEIISRTSKKVHRNYSIVGQLFHTYWIVETEQNMYMIDQHAAHERIIYEKLLDDFYTKSPHKQVLLQPIVIHVSPAEKLIVQKYQQLLHQFGFELEQFGEDAFVTRTIPILFDRPAHGKILQEMIDLLIEKEIPSVYETQVERVAVMACKAAVKAHDQLTSVECKKIIEDLMELENPYTCPHGRPTIIAMTQYEIEKKFKRIQG